MGERRCGKCRQVKDESEFGRNVAEPGGVNGRCRLCVREYERLRLARNREAINARRRERHRGENLRPELPSPGTPAWTQRRRWGSRVTAARYHAKRFKVAVNDLRLRDWVEIVAAHDGKCFYCHATGEMWIEHVVPISGGGDNTKSNVIPACEPCNRTKARRSVEQFAENLCGQGHPLTGSNVYVYPDGKKKCCKTCRAASLRRYRARQRAA